MSTSAAASRPASPARVAVTGATGFVGRRLVDALRERGHDVVGLSRAPRADARERLQFRVYDPEDPASIARAVDGCDAVVHLAGDNLFQGRWTAAKLARIRSSREAATAALVRGIAACANRPRVLVSASAVGYYGARPPEESLDEDSAAGTGFLADVCRGWEREALAAEALGVRVTVARLGIVLGRDGGALAKMRPPFRMFVGGPIGNGRQATSWVHVDDLCAMLVAMVEDDGWRGAVNATAPNPVSNRELSRALGKALHRPSFLPTPAFALRLALGKVSSILTTGQRVLPRAALARGFRFRFPRVEDALADLLGGGDASSAPAARRPGLRAHRLVARQFVPVPVDAAFAFFSEARNLERITPQRMRFRVVTEGPIAMRDGTTIDYRLRVGLLPARWTSVIEDWRPGRSFVDSMRRGPYRAWRHLHTFEPQDGGTVLGDLVEYEMPMGPLGRLAHALWVRRELAGVFEHRRAVIASIFVAGAPRSEAVSPAPTPK